MWATDLRKFIIKQTVNSILIMVYALLAFRVGHGSSMLSSNCVTYLRNPYRFCARNPHKSRMYAPAHTNLARVHHPKFRMYAPPQVANMGRLAAAEVVQVYAEWEGTTAPVPARQLVGFAKVRVAPGCRLVCCTRNVYILYAKCTRKVYYGG